MRVKVLSKSGEREYSCQSGENLLSFLQERGYAVAANCGGNGKCGKCRVRVLEGDFENLSDGYVLACRETIPGDCAVEVPVAEGGGLTYSTSADFATDGESGWGIALDLGTTTLAFALVDLATGKTLETIGELNAQGRYGADVLSRIAAADRGQAQALQSCVLRQTGEAIARFSEKFSLKMPKRLVVCGNPTMLHLFLGREVHGIGQYPFRTAFLDTVRVSGESLGLNVGEVVVLPSVSAYFGADIVAGGLCTQVCRGVNFLADIGTNGEMLLHAGGKLSATSTAAGPCFEGAGIECGTGGVTGAIDRVFEREGELVCHVIGGGKATGICGAGLVDAVALMYRKGILDGSGAFTNGETRFYLRDKIYVSQRDVRAFQLAKSAICAGIRVLLSRAGVPFERLENLYVAGGLGFYLNIENALEIGLFPAELKGRIVAVGNTALAGTRNCLCSGAQLKEAERMAKETEYIDLSASPEFMESYIENMGFGGENA